MVARTTRVGKILFFLLVIGIVLFSIFPFIQMISISLKYPGDWGNPLLIPKNLTFEAYKELSNIGQSTKNVPESVLTLPMGLKALFTSKNAIWDRIMAASVLTATPVIILFMTIQKNLAGGLAEGGVKE
jgi:ABC-type maltose transport system permease subunit